MLSSLRGTLQPVKAIQGVRSMSTIQRPAGNVPLVLRQAIKENIVGEKTPLVLFFDLSSVDSSVKALKSSFPDHFLHTLAVKANPTLEVMKRVYALGMGFESASIGELTQSLRAAGDPSRIVFDSPVKTTQELQLALSKGVNVNADNFQELERLCRLVKDNPEWYRHYTTKGRLGLRINPQVGSGSIATHSTGQFTSKFGVGLEDEGVRALILRYYKENPFLKMIHVHSGSQGMELQILAVGIKKVVDLAKVIGPQVDSIDMGGGLPVNFGSEEIKPTFVDYSAVLKQTVPELFDGTFKMVITEFGRAVLAKTGWFASIVEYTKNNGGRNIVLQHIGADIAIRTVYHPTVWPLRVSIHKPDGSISTAQTVSQDIAGPCCIAGDIIAHQRELPLAAPGDFVVVKDVGAYYHSSYSRYNCRQAPPVIGYTVEGDNVNWKLLQKGETVQESLEMFSRL
eukprot:TRINITY_DN1812_c0_g1_i1.p1 TRINITY_DN1812_c0_g1~~TRINITY_DN1812_c0_g1_i1.p1  ORF type:complete len:455 (+),score=86.39 TRINITY_DN1812_c0_g1_i1:39-1403(+)